MVSLACGALSENLIGSFRYERRLPSFRRGLILQTRIDHCAAVCKNNINDRKIHVAEAAFNLIS